MISRQTQPKINPIEIGDVFQPKVVVFENGIKNHIVNLGSQEVVQLELIFKAGSKYQEKPLVAAFTNKMLQEGTNELSSNQISEEIDSLGAFIQFQTTKDFASCILYSLHKNFESALDLFSKVVLSPTFPEKEFKVVLGNDKQKFIINNQKNEVLARKEFTKIVFSNTKYGKVVEEQDYDFLNVEDLKLFYETYYNSSNCEIFLSGCINDDILSKVQSVFGTESWGNISNKEFVFQASEYTPQQIFIEKKDAVQSAIRIGKTLVTKNNEDYIDLKILNTILGGYFGSRLMSNIREEKGYTYGIGSGVSSFIHEGQFVIATEVGTQVTKDALKEIYFEIERLRNETVPQEELELVKNYMLGSLLGSFDGPFAIAESYKNVALFDLEMDFYKKYEKSIHSISAERIKTLANKYLTKESLTEVVVGKIE